MLLSGMFNKAHRIIPISAVTNSQSVDQTVRVRIHFGTAGDLRRSITVNLNESFMSYKQYTYA